MSLLWAILSTQIRGASTSHPKIPRTWDDAALRELEVLLADPAAAIHLVPSDFYYKIPVRPIYLLYPVYAPGSEPSGYFEWLKKQAPVIVWNDQRKPPLKSEADWIRAGELVFRAPIAYDSNSLMRLSDVRSAEWYRYIGGFAAKDGTIPNVRYVIRTPGTVEVGSFACAFCHTRIMGDGSIMEGAQGNFPFDRAFAFDIRNRNTLPEAQTFQSFLYRAPWVRNDAQSMLQTMTMEEIVGVHEAIPPGVLARQRSSPFFPVQVPDLIGIKDRRYLDRTGLQQHRSNADLMRYSALNQGGDDLATFGTFTPIKLLGELSDAELFANMGC